MAIPLIVDGVTYAYPTVGDPADWGSQATAWASAVTNGLLPKTGGLWQLSGELEFGPVAGIQAKWFKTETAAPALSGLVRLANTDTISWRNAANTADESLRLSGGVLYINGSPLDVGVTSVGISSSDMTVTGSPVTHTGTIDLALNTVPITKGGTGQVTANAALNALLPTQTAHANQYLKTSGTNASWAALPTTYYGIEYGQPSMPYMMAGDIPYVERDWAFPFPNAPIMGFVNNGYGTVAFSFGDPSSNASPSGDFWISNVNNNVVIGQDRVGIQTGFFHPTGTSINNGASLNLTNGLLSGGAVTLAGGGSSDSVFSITGAAFTATGSHLSDYSAGTAKIAGGNSIQTGPSSTFYGAQVVAHGGQPSIQGAIDLITGNTTRLSIIGSGEWAINGTVGAAGQHLMSQGAGSGPVWANGVSSFNTRTGNIVLSSVDINSAMGFTVQPLTYSNIVAGLGYIPSVVAGSTSQVQFNLGGSASASSRFTYQDSGTTLGQLTVGSNTTAGEIYLGTGVSSQFNIIEARSAAAWSSYDEAGGIVFWGASSLPVTGAYVKGGSIISQGGDPFINSHLPGQTAGAYISAGGGRKLYGGTTNMGGTAYLLGGSLAAADGGGTARLGASMQVMGGTSAGDGSVLISVTGYDLRLAPGGGLTLNGSPVGGSTSMHEEDFVATAGQTVINTTITTTARSGTTSHLQVFVNGVLQMEGATKRFTVTGANQITFTSGLALNDDVAVFAFY
jgi:hypothetical protein